ncbi:MAG: MBL fold metallo-hydrolase [Deltaproteobacteria bacterium]|nr:MBL fold metallo-hydrolase [Deltaproteobacteria bacterium]
MIFRQLFDPETSTYTYLLADETTREAVLIDPVREHSERDATLVRELGLALRFTLETHVHADHITGADALREKLGSRAGVGAAAGVGCADLALADGAAVRVGGLELRAIATPGHTSGCTTYTCAAAGMAFTGDALLIRGCGRTDFQQGDARTLFRSVRERILTLPDATLLYPGHDYRGRTVTTVAEEKRWNPRLGLARSEDDFVAIMAALKLDYPRRMDESVPANLRCGTGPMPALRAPAVANLVAGQAGRQDVEVDFGAGI